MVEKILRMCKRLKQFSQAEIELISDIPLKEFHNILNTLVAENKITYSNGIYFYQKKEAPVKIKNIFHNYNAKTIDHNKRKHFHSHITHLVGINIVAYTDYIPL